MTSSGDNPRSEDVSDPVQPDVVSAEPADVKARGSRTWRWILTPAVAAVAILAFAFVLPRGRGQLTSVSGD